MFEKENYKHLVGYLVVGIFLFVSIFSTSVYAETTTIRILRPGTQSKTEDFIKPIIDEFNASQDDVNVIPHYMGWFSWIETYKTLFEAGDQPEIILWWDRNINEEGIGEKLVPLDNYVDEEILNKIPDRLKEQATVNGKTMMIPSSTSPLLFMWRKDVFEEAGLPSEEPPSDWNELLEYAETIKEKTDVYPIGISAKADESLVDLVSSIYFSMSGERWLDEDFNPQFNNENGLKALETFVKLKEYAQPGASIQSRGDIRAPFRDGRIAIDFTDGAWFFRMLEDRHGKDLGPIGVSKYPEGMSGNYSLVGLDSWVITSEEKAEAAGEFLSFLMKPENQYMHTVKYGVTPIYEEELEMEGLEGEHWKTAKDARDNWGVQRLGTGHPTPLALYDIAMGIFQSVWEEEISPEEALNEFEERVIELNEEIDL